MPAPATITRMPVGAWKILVFLVRRGAPVAAGPLVAVVPSASIDSLVDLAAAGWVVANQNGEIRHLDAAALRDRAWVPWNIHLTRAGQIRASLCSRYSELLDRIRSAGKAGITVRRLLRLTGSDRAADLPVLEELGFIQASTVAGGDCTVEQAQVAAGELARIRCTNYGSPYAAGK